MRVRLMVVAFVIGVLVGIGWPAVKAQATTRLYGTTSSGAIVPVLVDTSGRLQVVVITP